MKEDFLHYCWKYKRFNSFDFKLTSGEKLKINKFGFHNQDQGPDFLYGEISINETTWVGNIEIHINSSDWNNHKHQFDSNYNNVILHVVYNHDIEVKNADGSNLYTLELKDIIDESLYETYLSLIKRELPCANHLRDLPEIITTQFKDRLFIERLEHKSVIIKELLNSNSNSWEEAFYQQLFNTFGMKVNSDAFIELAKRTPLNLLKKSNDLKIVEAILFGNAGFLERDFKDQYFIDLQKEYAYQQKKFDFKPMKINNWKFSKLRPNNFPTVRIAQLSMLFVNNQNLFDQIIKNKISVEYIQTIFNVELLEGYWFNHYSFGKKSKEIKKVVGERLVNNIIINCVAPFAFVYGKYKKDDTYLNWLDTIISNVQVENNRITRKFYGLTLSNAKDSQATIQAYNDYCSNKKCLNCSVGNFIMNKKQD